MPELEVIEAKVPTRTPRMNEVEVESSATGVVQVGPSRILGILPS